MEKELNLSKKMTFDEILDHTIFLYKKHFFHFIRIISYFLVPGFIVLNLFYYYFINFYKKILTSAVTSAANMNFAVSMFSLFYYGAFVILLSSIFYILSQIAIVKSANDKIMKVESTDTSIILTAFKKLLPLMVAGFFSVIIMASGMIFCIIPGLVLGVFLIYIVQAVVIDDAPIFGSIGQSFSFVNGHFWPTLLILVVYFFVYIILSMIISYGIMSIPYINMYKDMLKNSGQTDPFYMFKFLESNFTLYIIQIVVNCIIQILISPLLSIALTIKYLNVKNLKEGTLLIESIQSEQNKTAD